MFVITADQVDSRSHADLVATTLDLLADSAVTPVLAADRTVGDELQLLLADGGDALAVILQLSRTEQWSVGCGVGAVNAPLPVGIREASGPAFIAARKAVERAKKRSTRFALEYGSAAREATTREAADVEAMLDLLLILRSRRTPEGWEVHDLLASGMTQSDAARRLGITPQAVSLRAQAAELRAEESAKQPLARLLGGLDSVESTATGGSA